MSDARRRRLNETLLRQIRYDFIHCIVKCAGQFFLPFVRGETVRGRRGRRERGEMCIWFKRAKTTACRDRNRLSIFHFQSVVWFPAAGGGERPPFHPATLPSLFDWLLVPTPDLRQNTPTRSLKVEVILFSDKLHNDCDALRDLQTRTCYYH